ncbi:outer membrane protein [Helicobacter sp. NHP22-001]|uniref:outer membrane protein n=1 Tax=Helicobacter sp. NHP22-001 TaxID=3040202 RepID=UPI00244D8F7E|nr:outer membrane protein [Helicobacter sp. NHP22-001]GMB96970.1 hypothetical protein NHP22001_15620 [Helicobacter sp. NHP22-001]
MAFLSLVPLSGEKNGFFVEGGLEYSHFSGLDTHVVKPVALQELIQVKQQEIEQEYVKTLVASGDTQPQAETYRNEHIASFYAYAKSAAERELLGIPASSKAPYDGNLFGVDLQVGYKQFFGKKKHWGLRYYGLISLQGGGFSQKTGNKYSTQGPVGNFFYGVGIDALWNFYHNKRSEFGVFVGVAVGGSSWTFGAGKANDVCQTRATSGNCVSMNDYYGNLTSANDGNVSRASFSPTFVQFLVNVGFRTNFTRHQGFEVGVRIPTIDDPYFKIAYTEMGPWGNEGTWKNLTFRRDVAIYANYVYNF